MEYKNVEFGYESIKRELDGELFKVYEDEEGEHIVFEYDGKDDDGFPVYKMSQVSKRDENGEWWCVRRFYRDYSCTEEYERVGA